MGTQVSGRTLGFIQMFSVDRVMSGSPHAHSPLPHLRVHKVPLVVVEALLAQVTVDQRLLQEVAAVHLVPRVLDLRNGSETIGRFVSVLLLEDGGEINLVVRRFSTPMSAV